MNSRGFRLLTASFVLGLCAAVSTQAATTTVVSGTVVDVAGKPIPGATLILRGGEQDQTTKSNEKGSYRFDAVAPGPYSLTIFKEDLSVITVPLTVGTEPLTKDVTLTLPNFTDQITVAFTAEHSQTALKTDLPVRDIPLTVQDYTGSFIKAIDSKQVDQLYTYMNGISRSGGGAYNFTVRGFAAGEPDNLMIDGMPGLTARMNAPNIANVDRIELLKGPASVLYGRGQPGGLLNIMTKKPLHERQMLFDLRTGTFSGTGPGFGKKNSYRGTFDITGPVGSSDRAAYRFIASYDDSKSFRDNVQNTDLLIAPSYSLALSANTLLDLSAEYRKVNTSLDNGLIAPLNDIKYLADITTRYQEPNDFENERGFSLNAHLTHATASGATFTLNWRSVYHHDERNGFENNRVESDNRRVRRRDRLQKNDRAYHSLDGYWSKTVSTGSVDHDLMVGANVAYEHRDFNRIRFGNVGFYIDLYDPIYGQAVRPENGKPGTHALFTFYDTGLYLQDRISLSDQWKALLSLRYAREKTDYEEVRSEHIPRTRTIDAVLPLVGLVYQPDEQWSLYASYSTSFDPQTITAEDANGKNSFAPQKGDQSEAGVKAILADGRVDTNLAFFHIIKKNIVLASGMGYDIAIGQQRSQGVEYDLRVSPVPNWQLILGYAYTQGEITEDTKPINIGAHLLNTPRHAANLWSRYDFTKGSAAGLGFGIGIIYRGDRAGSFPVAVNSTEPVPGQPTPHSVLILPSYVRLDAGVYWVQPGYEVTLRITNLTDKVYYESAFNTIQIRPGSPREATLSLRLRM